VVIRVGVTSWDVVAGGAFSSDMLLSRRLFSVGHPLVAALSAIPAPHFWPDGVSVLTSRS